VILAFLGVDTVPGLCAEWLNRYDRYTIEAWRRVSHCKAVSGNAASMPVVGRRRQRLTQQSIHAQNGRTQADVWVIGESASGNLDTNFPACTKWPDGSPGRSVGAGRPVRVAVPIPLCSYWRDPIFGKDVEVASPSGGRTLALSNHRGGKQCR